MQPHEFRPEDIEFSYIPNTSFYRDFSVKVDMKCLKTELDTGYKKWLGLDKLYEKHNGEVSRMFVQLEAVIADKYKEYLKNKFKVPSDYLKSVPFILFGYGLTDDQAPFIQLHKFKKDIFKQIKRDFCDTN